MHKVQHLIFAEICYESNYLYGFDGVDESNDFEAMMCPVDDRLLDIIALVYRYQSEIKDYIMSIKKIHNHRSSTTNFHTKTTRCVISLFYIRYPMYLMNLRMIKCLK